MRVLVVGAGIGGLTATLALRESGFDAHVYEQARVLREVGVGLVLGANAVRVLHRLGLAEALRTVGVRSESWDFCDWQSGEVVGRVPLGDAGEVRWGAPFYNVHRADLHDVLRAAVGEEHITLGACCVSVDQDDTGAAAVFADGRRERGDLLIGADGIHSVVRDYVTGPDLPTWWPQIVWRGLAPAAIGLEVGLEMRQQVFFGPDALFVTYYVSSGRLVNWIGCMPSDGWREESWSARGDRKDASSPVRGLVSPGAGPDRGHRAGVQVGNVRPTVAGDLDQRPCGAVGGCCPSDDAFHGTGAAQSIEDALVLACCLAADRDDPQRAVDTYASCRRDRAAALQAASREQGRDLQSSDPAEVAARNAEMRQSPEAPTARYDWAWGYDVERADRRSLVLAVQRR